MSTTLKSGYGDIFQNNKEFDEVFQNSIKLENKINQSGTTIEKELERVERLINNCDDSIVLKRKEKSFKKSCKCQHGGKCKCGQSCQCASLKSGTNRNKKQRQSNSKDIYDSLSVSKSKKNTWSSLWSKKKKTKQRDMYFNKSPNLKGNKRTHLKGELSPNSPKDKEMIEIFAIDNDKHSIQNRLVFPNPSLEDSYNTNINDFEYTERYHDMKDNNNNNNHTNSISVGKVKNREHRSIYNNEMMLYQQQKRESFISSEDYSIFKLQNSNKYNKLKGQNRNEEMEVFYNTKSNQKSPELKEKRNILNKIWSTFRFKSSKIPQTQSDEETYPNLEGLYFELNDGMGESNITTNVNNFLSTEPNCLVKDQADDIKKNIKTINNNQIETPSQN